MADPHNIVPGNTPGAYYVDESCVDCDQCRSNAPEVFARSDLHGLSYVHQQPHGAEQVAAAEEARLGCPSDSIGNDGQAGGLT